MKDYLPEKNIFQLGCVYETFNTSGGLIAIMDFTGRNNTQDRDNFRKYVWP
jgi:hypothetical protein